MKAIAERGGKLSRHEEQTLQGLEKEVRAVKKARDAMGDSAPSFKRGWNRDGESGSGMLGKRRRGSHDANTSDEEIPNDVKSIPMPRDTPPPIPKDIMDKWYAERRAKRDAENANRQNQDKEKEPAKKETSAIESKTVYEAKPVVRDLRKEAVSAFVPTSVQVKMNKGQGQGGLLEPEEADRLEKEGYLKSGDGSGQRQTQAQASGQTETDEAAPSARHVTMEDVEEDED